MNNPVLANRPENHSARRINFLARRLQARRYLEVGVAAGATFLKVAIAERVAVDPKFQFDTAPHASSSTRFHEIPSDQFFVGAGGEPPFDLMFIDGLHTFEQTLRDFHNSLSLAHARTVWLIDDTLPSDIYSAWPNVREAHQNRKAAGGTGNDWHGDVFKVVFALRDFFPMFSYCTINTGGNPQTLVWREPRQGFTPLFNSYETISRMEWFALQRHIKEMRLVDEQTGLRLVLRGLGQELPAG